MNGHIFNASNFKLTINLSTTKKKTLLTQPLHASHRGHSAKCGDVNAKNVQLKLNYTNEPSLQLWMWVETILGW